MDDKKFKELMEALKKIPLCDPFDATVCKHTNTVTIEQLLDWVAKEESPPPTVCECVLKEFKILKGRKLLPHK